LPPLLAEAKERGFAELHERLAEAGYPDIRAGHGCVFRFVAEGGMRLTDLAEAAGFTKQAVGEVVADLERLGYVERVPDPADGRAKLVRLSERGHRARELAGQMFEEIEAGWAERLGEERLATFREVLEELAAGDRAVTPV